MHNALKQEIDDYWKNKKDRRQSWINDKKLIKILEYNGYNLN